MNSCRTCGNELTPTCPNKKYCSIKCRTKYYSSLESYKKYDRKYKHSQKYYCWLKKYHASNKYKEVIKRCRNKKDYYSRRKIIAKKYNNSFKGFMNKIKYDLKRQKNLTRVLHNITEQEYNDKRKAARGVCLICNKHCGDNLNVDHVPPISLAPNGFEYRIKNIRFICFECNKEEYKLMRKP